MNKQILCGWAVVAASLPGLGLAQPAAAPASAPALAYHSAFSGYTPYRDASPGDWRALNQAVGTAALKPPRLPQPQLAAEPAPQAASRPMPHPMSHPMSHPMPGMTPSTSRPQPGPMHGGQP
ncbi:hypothetical protein KGA65_03650 [Ideonella sp. B7]|uniref:hypothetical protein n=1 Tax=Ideonella benzenivorans TaxID=2831643 RepID=UPI001CEC1816|nr:hypothetical protein [Ideonella benzenivorans]MCA6215633.1 hypothetical protein [Ideonella benzenivorans]